jgi:hypothetical protein
MADGDAYAGVELTVDVGSSTIWLHRGPRGRVCSSSH